MIFLGDKSIPSALRISILTRDKYACRKCKIDDKTGRSLEVHHIKPKVFGGTDDKENLITLCYICHKYAQNHLDEFKEYMDSECDGQLTALLKAFKIVREQRISEGKPV